MTTTLVQPTRVHANRRTSWLPLLAVGWALAYGGLRSYWALGARPWLPPTGDDLLIFSDWGVVGLAAAVTVLAPVLAADRGPRILRLGAVVLAYVVGLTLVVAACAFVLDVVATLFPGIGIPTSPIALASRAGCLTGGLLMVISAVLAGRRVRATCLRCGRVSTHPSRPDPGAAAVRAPRWAVLASYVAVAACLIREGAQWVVGFDATPLRSGSAAAGLAFLVAFTLAGTLLPLALVHSWGQVWPRWTLWLAGRRVPRWLVAGPALAVAGAITLYFGYTFAEMLLFGPPSAAEAADLGPVFFWVAVPAYLIWGIALGIAALSYFARTRPICLRCGG